MFKNYIKIAFRNLLKNKVYSFINIFGLAIGMAVTIMIGLWIADELSHDSNFKYKGQIAQVYQSQKFNGKIGTGPAIPRPLEFELRNNYGDNFKHMSMATWTAPRYLKYGDKSISRDGNFMQEEALEMFNFTIIKGAQNALDKKNAVMLSQTTAKDLFGEEEPIGKLIMINNEYSMEVTAIFEDLPVNCSFNDIHYLMPWKHYITAQEWLKDAAEEWGNNSFQLFVQLQDNGSMKAVSEKIKDAKKNIATDEAEFNPQLFLQPMDDWYLRNDFVDGVKTGGRIENLWLFGIIGVFVLLLACINFINLSTARSEKRATEVGIRKSIGSKRAQLIFQFLSESL